LLLNIIGKKLSFPILKWFNFFCIYTATTHDQEVFSFHTDHSSCHGFEEVLACYQKVVPNLRLSGDFHLSLLCSYFNHFAQYAVIDYFLIKDCSTTCCFTAVDFQAT